MHEADTDIKFNGSMLLSFIDTINGIIKQVDDIHYAGKLSPTKAEEVYDKTTKYINKKGEAIAENESKVYHNYINPTQELIFCRS
ncbi:MAG: hypothetical protein IIT46_11455 [Lachnospiraceae bacterium]|nr:hypothetical protein [Lachnospiraceae bacterium]